MSVPTLNTNPSVSLLSPPIASNSLSVQGQYFVITGGTQGLGFAIAQQLKRNGAAGLVLVSRSVQKGQAAVAALQSPSCCRVWHVVADLRDAEQASNVMAQAEQVIHNDNNNNDNHNNDEIVITGLVNAAAITDRGNLFSTTATDFDAPMQVNVRAPFLLTQAFANHLLQRRAALSAATHAANAASSSSQENADTATIPNRLPQGSIVNIASCASYGGAPFIMAYSVSKAALVALTKNNAHELAPHNIRVNAINMGWCATDHEHEIQRCLRGDQWLPRADAGVPLGRILRPADVAVTVNYLLSSASSMTTACILELHPEFPHGMLALADQEPTSR